MPRYFIDTDDGTFKNRDSSGFDLPDRQAARLAALDALPDMARVTIPDGDQRQIGVVVRDDRGMIVYSATLSLSGRWGDHIGDISEEAGG